MNKYFSLIVCTDIKNGIGKNGCIPWKLPQDMRNFKYLTTNQIVVMGRKTWESLPVQPLPNRVNIIISNTLNEFAPQFSEYKEDVLVFPTIDQMVRFRMGLPEDDWYNQREWFIIGGSSLYNHFLSPPHINLLNKIYWTTLYRNSDCDTLLKIGVRELPSEWIETISLTTMKLNKSIRALGRYQEMIKL